MKSPLRILHLEDDPNDAALIQSTLAAGGIACAFTCVQSHDDFVAALERGGIDLILSDCALPAFDGLSAVEIVRARWPDLPVILVSGTMGEERAIDSLKNGATDYVLKERLSRLVPAVRRAMEEVTARTERRRLEAQFVEAQKMEVLGQLASGVAHDFNNILAVIMGYGNLITAELGADSPLRKYTEDALRAVHEHKGPPIRLVITDVIMPLMGGKVMADWLKTSYPGLKILFTSGYTDDAIAQHGGLDAGVEFLPKPYTSTTLVRKVREMLDNGNARMGKS